MKRSHHIFIAGAGIVCAQAPGGHKGRPYTRPMGIALTNLETASRGRAHAGPMRRHILDQGPGHEMRSYPVIRALGEHKVRPYGYRRQATARRCRWRQIGAGVFTGRPHGPPYGSQ